MGNALRQQVKITIIHCIVNALQIQGIHLCVENLKYYFFSSANVPDFI
jgi:hypothetical protein